jgi:hypothetical protein
LKYILITIIVFAIGCSSEKHPVSQHFTENERDILLKNIITFIYTKAPGANDSTKWLPKYSSYYTQNLPSFYLENYSIGSNGWHYYFVIRPVGGSDKRRGVIGKFKLADNSLMPINFEETVNTPHLEEEVVRERGNFLFQEFVKSDNLDKYLAMKQYIEWPDKTLIYNKLTNKWEAPISKILAE